MRVQGKMKTLSTMVSAGLLLALGLAPALGPGVAAASGGGGCGRPISDARGIRVTIRNYCYGPTILRVRPGQTVTWINKDTFPHSVLGANGVWGGYEALRGRHNRVAYRFVRPGVYPYVCPYHVGMLGAVVAGNGRGLGAAHTTATKTGPVVLVPQEEAVRSRGASIELRTSPQTAVGVWLIRGVTGFGLTLIAIVALALRRRRRMMRLS